MSTTDENIEAVKKMILNNRQISIREVADDIGISFGLCQAIFMDVLDMKRATAKIVPKLLNFEQTQHCMDIAQEMLTTFNGDPDLIKNVKTSSKPKPNHPNGSVQKNVKCEDFAHCLLRLQWRAAS